MKRESLQLKIFDKWKRTKNIKKFIDIYKLKTFFLKALNF